MPTSEPNKTLRVHPEIEHPDYPHGDVLIVQPDEDLVDYPEPDPVFEVGERVSVLIPANDNTEWHSSGQVVAIDLDDDPVLLAVRINWGEATIRD